MSITAEEKKPADEGIRDQGRRHRFARGAGRHPHEPRIATLTEHFKTHKKDQPLPPWPSETGRAAPEASGLPEGEGREPLHGSHRASRHPPLRRSIRQGPKGAASRGPFSFCGIPGVDGARIARLATDSEIPGAVPRHRFGFTPTVGHRTTVNSADTSARCEAHVGILFRHGGIIAAKSGNCRHSVAILLRPRCLDCPRGKTGNDRRRGMQSATRQPQNRQHEDRCRHAVPPQRATGRRAGRDRRSAQRSALRRGACQVPARSGPLAGDAHILTASNVPCLASAFPRPPSHPEGSS